MSEEVATQIVKPMFLKKVSQTTSHFAKPTTTSFRRYNILMVIILETDAVPVKLGKFKRLDYTKSISTTEIMQRIIVRAK
jgi:hypothetical protein